MAFNGSGVFTVDTSGTPVVTNTVIDSTMFNALLTELSTGLTNAICKDGQSTTTAIIPFNLGITVNESGADSDFRVESDAVSNHFIVDAGAFSGIGAFSFGRVASTENYFNIHPGAITAAANSPFYRVYIGANDAVTVPSGTASLVASLNVQEPNITATGTVTEAATVYIAAAPTEGSANYALFVAAGLCRFGGGVRFGTHSGLAAETVTGYITITDDAGNSRKLAVVS